MFLSIIQQLITRTSFWSFDGRFHFDREIRAVNFRWVEFLSSMFTLDLLGESVAADHPFPLDRLWVAPTNKLLTDMNVLTQEWRSPSASFLGPVVAEQKSISWLPDSYRLTVAHRIDFVDSLETAEFPSQKLSVLDRDGYQHQWVDLQRPQVPHSRCATYLRQR
jgi:hypothetical protein